MGTTYNRSYSPASMSRVGLAGTDVEDICDRVHALNKSVHKLLEETDSRFTPTNCLLLSMD